MAMFFSELQKENRQSFVVVIIIVLSNLVFVSLLVCQIFGQLNHGFLQYCYSLKRADCPHSILASSCLYAGAMHGALIETFEKI